jgi:hypothetical protein
MSSNSKPEVFIIESLDLSDEKLGYSEGKMLCQLLRMMEKEPLYYYIRTKQEMRAMAREFEQSRYRYLHISCHGTPDNFRLSLDAVTFGTFARIFRPVLRNRRVFLSACDIAQVELANRLFRDLDTAPYSLTGPTQDIYFSDAAVIWASLYNLLFKDDSEAISGPRLREHLAKLCELNSVSFAHFGRITSSPHYKEYDFAP